MNRRSLISLGLAALLVLVLATAAVAAGFGPGGRQNAQGRTTAFGTQSTPITVDRSVPLSDEEIQGILYMREEEKLAHDVYTALYQMWGLPVFQNIAGSEATHLSAVATLIQGYGLEDPITDKGAGEFTNETLQALYDQLIEQGSQSLEAALRVGAAIEEIDILDLQIHMAETTAADLLRVYGNLARGSENHLRAFVSTLQRQTGESYLPQYMDQTAFSEILKSGPGRARR